MKRFAQFCLLVIFCGVLSAPRVAFAHVGSKDVFEQVEAGPYKLFVTIRMPNVIPGVATVEARSTGAAITDLQITPMPLTGEAAQHPPTSDAMRAAAGDPAFFSGNVWMMANGSWQIRFDIAGDAGKNTISVPVPAVAIATLKMQRGLEITLALLGLFLIISMAGIVAAAVSESRLDAGSSPSAKDRRWARIAVIVSLVFMAFAVWGGARWWSGDALDHARGIYRPLQVTPTLNGNVLDLNVSAFPGKHGTQRSNNDFLPDHGHLMHLYLIRQPQMDAVFHLHPELNGAGDFRLSLPSMPPGEYKLYGDVVHGNGFPETLVTQITVSAGMAGAAPGSDDAVAMAPPLSQGQFAGSFVLPDGLVMTWDKPAVLVANTAYAFHFTLTDAHGKAPSDMSLYMGMVGHAAFVKTDGTVFAHTHPEGSVPMASLMLANGGAGETGDGRMAGMDMSNAVVPNVVDFPYGFPSPGRYRIFIQMEHGTTIETGVFDAMVQ